MFNPLISANVRSTERRSTPWKSIVMGCPVYFLSCAPRSVAETSAGAGACGGCWPARTPADASGSPRPEPAAPLTAPAARCAAGARRRRGRGRLVCRRPCATDAALGGGPTISRAACVVELTLAAGCGGATAEARRTGSGAGASVGVSDAALASACSIVRRRLRLQTVAAGLVGGEHDDTIDLRRLEHDGEVPTGLAGSLDVIRHAGRESP